MIAQAWALLATALVLVAAVAAGSVVLRLLDVRAGPGERTLYALGIGLGVQGALVLACSALGLMSAPVLWGAVLLPALAGLRELRVLGELAQRAKALADSVSSWERLLALGIGLSVLFILAVGAMVPVSDWDSLMYHLRIPKQLLEAGRLLLPADGNHLAFLGLLQFLYLPLLAAGAEAGPALLNAALTALLGLILLVAGARLFALRTGLLAGIAVWGSASLLLVGSTPRVDVAVTAMLALAHLAALRSWDDDAPWAIAVTALLAGVALGMKYHALPYAAALAPIVVWGAWRHAARTAHAGRRMVATLGVGVLLATVMVAPWLVKNVAFFDAPLYPFFTTERVPPFIAEISGSVTPPADISREALRAVGRAREPISLAGLLRTPERLTVEVEASAYTRNPIFFLLPLLLLFLRDWRLLGLVMPGVAYLAFTLGYFNHTNLRYIIPALPMLALACAELARRTMERFGGGRWVSALTAAAALATLPALRVGVSRLVSIERVQVAAGLLPPQVMLNREVPYVVAEYFRERVPSDARILMLWDARGYHFTQTALQDNLLTNWVLLRAVGATDRCLAGTGITHVYLNAAAPPFYERRGVRLGDMGWDAFPEFAQRCLEPLELLPNVAIYRVR